MVLIGRTICNGDALPFFLSLSCGRVVVCLSPALMGAVAPCHLRRPAAVIVALPCQPVGVC